MLSKEESKEFGSYEKLVRLQELEDQARKYAPHRESYMETLRQSEIRARLDEIVQEASNRIAGARPSNPMPAQAAYLDERGVIVEAGGGGTRIQLGPELMRKVVGLVQMYELSKLVPDAKDEPQGSLEFPQAHP